MSECSFVQLTRPGNASIGSTMDLTDPVHHIPKRRIQEKNIVNTVRIGSIIEIGFFPYTGLLRCQDGGCDEKTKNCDDGFFHKRESMRCNVTLAFVLREYRKIYSYSTSCHQLKNMVFSHQQLTHVLFLTNYRSYHEQTF